MPEKPEKDPKKRDQRKTKISEKKPEISIKKIGPEKEPEKEESKTETPPPPPAQPQIHPGGFGNPSNREISDEMETSYLDYAMSVIVSRALPDVRDGLKPVHRRILYAMHGMGLRAATSFRKSAAVVGDVLGKYHPHGDTPVYDALARMAQDFSMRYPLVRGQGNFGSIDGDNPAAMRYTEAKLERITEEMLADIDKETIPWQDNYDGKFKEPVVLPSRIPQLLLNGTSGIAVGMATSIPPHNLGELIDGAVHLADTPEATVEDLMQFIKGPDLPTKGLIYDIGAIKAAYTTGRGGVIMRARAEIEEHKNGRFVIVVTEIPYQVNKTTLVLKIAELVRDKKIQGITDLRDESNREGIRITIELKKEAYPKKILNQLYKMTQLQETFNFNMIALVEGVQPKLLDLKQILEYFLTHRKTVIVNRTKFELKVAKERAHILEGLKVALDHIDAVIETIKKSETREDAHAALMKKFKLSEKQATAILEMKLQTLAGLERKKIDDEYKEKLALIEDLECILNDPKKVVAVMKRELIEIKGRFADARRTEIIPHGISEITSKDTIPNEPMIVMVTRENYVKRVPPSMFRSQKRGGKGIIGLTTKEEDEIKMISYTRNHEEAMFFTNQGRVFRLPVYEIPLSSRISKGQPLVNLLQLRPEEFVTAMMTTGEEFKGEFLMMCTKNGTIKKTPIEDFKNVRKNGLIAIKIRENDSLHWVKVSAKGGEVMIVTRNGKCIRFSESNVRPIGRNSIGIRGIRLKDHDEVVEMDVIKKPEQAELLVVMENGLGKCTPVTSYRFQNRGGSGVKTANITTKTGRIIGAKVLQEDTRGDLLLVSKEGQLIRMDVKAIPSRGRATQGVYLMRLNGNDKVASISIVFTEEGEEAKTLALAEVETMEREAGRIKEVEEVAKKDTQQTLI